VRVEGDLVLEAAGVEVGVHLHFRCHCSSSSSITRLPCRRSREREGGRRGVGESRDESGLLAGKCWDAGLNRHRCGGGGLRTRGQIGVLSL
jgi:hypothetical protein